MAISFENIVGMSARGIDGVHVGKIIERVAEGFTTERMGFVFPHDTFVPYSEIERVEPDHVVLREPGAYYRAGGDMDDAHWTADTARRSRLVRQSDVAHDVGLPDRRD